MKRKRLNSSDELIKKRMQKRQSTTTCKPLEMRLHLRVLEQKKRDSPVLIATWSHPTPSRTGS